MVGAVSVAFETDIVVLILYEPSIMYNELEVVATKISSLSRYRFIDS